MAIKIFGESNQNPVAQEASREAARKQLSLIPGAYWVKR